MVALVAVLGACSAGSTADSGGAGPSGTAVLRLAGTAVAPPPGLLPQHLGIGVEVAPGDIGGWVAGTGIPFDYVYQYLAGGAGTSSDWTSWDPNATFPLDYAKAAWAARHVPVFSYYNLLQSADPCGSCSESERDLANLDSPSTMTRYFDDFTTLMERLGPGSHGGIAGFGRTVVVQIEPDLSAYAEQASIDKGRCYGFCTGEGNDPDHVKAAVGATGDTDVAGYANTYHGFVLALAHIRDLYAPNVVLGYHVSDWASLTDVGGSTKASLPIVKLAETVASFTESSGAGRYDVLFNDLSDRDAGFYETYGSDVWWDRDNVKFPNFHRWETYLGVILASVGKPAFVWQIPVGNQYFDTENNSWGHTQDNRVEYFFAHPRELTAIGVIGLLFGGGNAGSTSFEDSDKDGVKNFKPFCTAYGSSDGKICDSHPAVSADDDGGYLRTVSAAYYRRPIALAAAPGFQTQSG